MAEYLHKAIAELRAELIYSPAEVLSAHLRRLEALLEELRADQKYPLAFIRFRITGFESAGETVLGTGEELRPDLMTLLQDLSDVCRESTTAQNEPILRINDIAEFCNVTVRTVHRWRRDGLVTRKFLFDDGKMQAAVRQSALERFLETHAWCAEHAKAFSRLSEGERAHILERARALRAAEGLTFSDVLRRLAQETGRARETIRYTLRRLDVQHVFPDSPKPLDAEERERIYAEYRRGADVAKLAAKFARSRSVIYAAVRGAARQEVLEQRISFMPSAEFMQLDAARVILGKDGLDLRACLPDVDIDPVRHSDDLPDMSTLPVLTREQEADLFRKYNYVKYRMARLQEHMRAHGCEGREMKAFFRLQDAAFQLRKTLIRCNLRLVISIARRHMGPLTSLADLVSNGNMALLRAVEKFDYTLGHKFSTYGGWAITKQFARTIPAENYQLTTFVTGTEAVLHAAQVEQEDVLERRDWLGHLRHKVAAALNTLTAREQEVIAARFGIAGQAPKTLEELGAGFGLTRERIRQIEITALAKLHDLLGPEAAELLPT